MAYGLKRNTMTNIKTVFLDVDDTLLDFHKCAEVSMFTVARELSLSFPENAMEIFHPINNGLWEKINSGELTIPELYKVRWNMVLSAMGIDYDGEEFEKRFLKTLHETAVKTDGALELVEYLSKKYNLHVASNAPEKQQQLRLEKAGLLQYFDKIFTSEKIGYAKPQSEFYAFCLQGLKPCECCMIGDSLSADVDGAEKAGMKAIWFNKKGQNETRNVVVTSLAEIMNIL